MLWIEAVRKLSSNLTEPFELEFVYRGQHELSKLDWLNLMRTEISDTELSNLTRICNQLLQNVPPQYLVGWAEFCELRFKVDERVLIPRPETEELVRMILDENVDKPLKILDIGTGSGAIAISLAKNCPNWNITACDISDAAITVAHENALKNHVDVTFAKSDVLSNITETFDIIVSNPPYIAFDELDEMDESVKTYEPKTALFAENQGLAIYEKIAAQSVTKMTENGKIYLEIGYKQGKSVQAIFQEKFPSKTVKIHQDIFGKDRMISVK